MKKVITILFVMVFIPTFMMADGYKKMWDRVEEAREKDLPQTQMEELKKIIDRAKKRHDYGQLLSAQLMYSGVRVQLTPDSMQWVFNTLESEAAALEKKDEVMAAVYYNVLGKLYEDDYTWLVPGATHEEAMDKSRGYYKKSLANPALLAKHKAGELAPALSEGADSYIFKNDLLSVLGYTAQDFETLHAWYDQHGPRTAAMMTALELVRRKDEARMHVLKDSRYVAQLDSLISRYGDLPECAEVALARYEYISNCYDVEKEGKIKCIDETLARWGKWKTMDRLRNDRMRLTNPEFRVTVPSDVVPAGKPMKVEIKSVRNIKSVTLRLLRLNLTGDNDYNPEIKKDYAALKEKIVAGSEKKWVRTFNIPNDYESADDEFEIEGQPKGLYLLEMFADESTVPVRRALLSVSDLYLIHQDMPDQKIRMVVVNSTTGHPVPGAKIDCKYRIKNNVFETVTLTCDANGEAVCSNKDNRYPQYAWPHSNGDEASPRLYLGWQNGYSNPSPSREDNVRVEFFTDRAIYRPGQTVHVSVLAFKTIREWTTEVMGNRHMKLALRDANHKIVKEENVETDEFGAAEADFVLPTTGLTGTFTLQSSMGHDSHYIRVEEYKRPTFEVEFDPYKEKYKQGETITVTGHARSYAGVPVQGAKVHYVVNRSMAWWYWWRDRNEDAALVAEGDVETDENGAFHVNVPLVLPVGDDGFFRFNVEANVTDQGGESHEGELELPLSRRETAFFCNVPEMSEKEKLKTITFGRRNAAGNDIDGEVRFTIDGKNPRVVKANEPVDINAMALNSGKHVLEATCGDDKLKEQFILFGLDDKKPCIETHDWFYQTSKEFDREGKTPVTVQVGTSDADTYILYNVFSKGEVLENSHMVLSNAIDTREYLYKDEYNTGLLLTYAWVKDGKFYTHRTQIRRPDPDKSLKMTWTTFRDKLKPGQKEEWALTVKKPDGKPTRAQVVATLYDQSLDQLQNHSWNVYLGIHQYLPMTRWEVTHDNIISKSSSAQIAFKDVPTLEFSSIDENLLNNYMEYWSPVIKYDRQLTRTVLGNGAHEILMESRPMMKAAAEPTAVMADMAVSGEDEVSLDSLEDVSVAGKTTKGDKKSSQSEQVRENLNETAFFMPRRMTDGKGNLKFIFTLPESITTWQFKAMAHDKDMNYGWLDGECVAKKDVMVQPNMPRFLRIGDKAMLTSKVINTAEKAVSGTARMTLIDPETEKVVLEREQQFSVEKGQTGNVSFSFSTDELSGEVKPLYICKIMASGKGFSDGEQHYLPILPNTERVTNTKSITQHEPGTATIDLKTLFPEGSSQRQLTVEYTNNPAWLMVQSLPYMSRSNDKDAISQASAFYANKLGKFILNQSPTAKTTFEQWRREQGSETSLMSSLQKNQELKNLVLEETPWVMDAKRESDQKQALSNFFDENILNSRMNTNLENLASLQNADGSFSWWPGMPGSTYITAEVMEILARLNMLTNAQNDTRSMLDRAHDYLSKVVVREVKEFKEREKKGEPVYISSYHALQWVYINAISDRKLSAKEREAADYLMAFLEKQKLSQSLYGKALMAVALFKDGKKEKALEYVESLKQYSVFKEEKGRYFDTRRAGYSWFSYNIPTQVATIEALRLITPNDMQTIDEMKRWLLMEKRSQSWDTPINSVNAIYAFLNGNSNVLDQQEHTELAIDGKNLTLPQATAGIGYVKTVAENPDGKLFTATKSSKGTSWGALYAQFMQPTSEVEESAEGLSVTREVLVDGKPMQDGQKLHVGDRVTVRIIIKAEDNYDFVQVTDKRAACMEPVTQLSGYHWGYYIAPKDQATNYYFDLMRKGTHIVEKEYYVDRAGRYESGTCTVQCAYSPEYSARARSLTFVVE